MNVPREKPDFRARLHDVPHKPGVYLMRDRFHRVIYVGKAAVLPERVSSYFVPSADLGYKKQPLLDVVCDFDTIECEGEWEALLAENRLIKDIHPRFNARLTDDKTFPYLAITLREDFPRVVITRSPGEFKGAKLYGPFTAVEPGLHFIDVGTQGPDRRIGLVLALGQVERRIERAGFIEFTIHRAITFRWGELSGRAHHAGAGA